MVSLPWLGRKGPNLLDCPGAWGRSIRVGNFVRETSTTRQRRGNVRSICCIALGCNSRARLRPVSEEEEIVVGVVGDFFFALSLAGTFGPPQEER